MGPSNFCSHKCPAHPGSGERRYHVEVSTFEQRQISAGGPTNSREHDHRQGDGCQGRACQDEALRQRCEKINTESSKEVCDGLGKEAHDGFSREVSHVFCQETHDVKDTSRVEGAREIQDACEGSEGGEGRRRSAPARQTDCDAGT